MNKINLPPAGYSNMTNAMLVSLTMLIDDFLFEKFDSIDYKIYRTYRSTNKEFINEQA